MMYAKIAWVLLSSGTQVQPQTILDPDYLPDYFSVSYDYDQRCFIHCSPNICSTRKKNELHLSSERELLLKCFAFNHISYSFYLTFQHVNFSEIKQCNEKVWKDLLREGFGGSLSGKPFSIHGDLITDVTIKREVKVLGGPMMGGYSTSDKKNDVFIKTSFVMAKVRSKLKKQVDLLSSCVRKELSQGSRKYHDNIAADMKEKFWNIVIHFLMPLGVI